MALDNFRTQKIIWDRANKKIFEAIEANAGDSNGRKLVVQVINQETTENLFGTTLSLGWKHRQGAKGLDAFNVVDASKGIFEIYYTTKMLSNIGNIEASLILINTTSRIESSAFTISVRPSTVDDESVESENSFTALTKALVKVNDFDAQLAQTKSELDAKKIDKNRGSVTSADLSQEVKEQMTGGSVAVVGENSVLKENVVDGQITASKLSILSRGLNLFNGDYEQVALRSGGDYVKDNLAKTVIIPVVGGRTYYLRSNGGNRRRLAWFKDKPVATDTPQFADYFKGDVSFGNWGITAPEDATYMMYMVSHSQGDTDLNLQVTVDKDYPYFIGYDFLSISNIQGLDSSLGNINGTFFAELYGTLPLLSIDYTKREIRVPVGVRVLYNGDRRIVANEGVNIPFEDVSGRFVLVYFDTEINEINVDYLTGASLPEKGIPIAILHPREPIIYGLDDSKCEINGELFIPKHIEDRISKENYNTNPVKYFSVESITGTYEKPNNILNKVDGNPVSLINSKHTDVYDIYDKITTDFPHVATRFLKAEDEAGLPIYEYQFDFSKIENSSNFTMRKPKLLVTSAIHGYEQGSAWSTAKYFEDLFVNPKNQQVLNFIKNNVTLKVIPVVNPYGYDNNQRTNYNLVDLNRNFPEGWRESTPSEYVNSYYGGSEPLNQIGSQVVVDWLNENSDADWYIDYHNISSGYPMTYADTEDAATIANGLYTYLSRKWKNDYEQAPDNELMGYVRNGVNATQTKYALRQVGLSVMLLETPWKIPFAESKYDAITIETGTDALGNLIVALVKSLF